MTPSLLHIAVFNRQTDLRISTRQVKMLVRAVLTLEQQTCHEVSIHFVSQKKICSLHEEYFNDPSSTDCISFPLDSPEEMDYRILGDVFICPKVAIISSEKYRTTPYYEATLYVVHGILHLLGYDDCNSTVKKTMRRAEKKQMGYLKNLGLWLNPPPSLSLQKK